LFADKKLVESDYATLRKTCRCYISKEDIILFDASNEENIEKLLQVVLLSGFPQATIDEDVSIIRLVTGYGITDLANYIIKLKRIQYEKDHPPPPPSSRPRRGASKGPLSDEQIDQLQEYPSLSSSTPYVNKPEKSIFLSPVGYFYETDGSEDKSKPKMKITGDYLNKKYAKILNKYVGNMGIDIKGWIYPFANNIHDTTHPGIPFRHEIMLFKPNEVLVPGPHCL
jgi:hypothetical protein